MSAFIHSKNHIDYLVTALANAGLLGTHTPDEAGRLLWRENLISVACRYPNDEDGERPGPVDFRDADVVLYTWTATPLLSGVALHTAIRGYAYQSCEHAGWKTSEARRLVDELDALADGHSLDDEHWEL